MAVDRDYLQAQIAGLRMLADAAERAGDTAQAATYLRLRAHQMDKLRELEERLQPAKSSGSLQPMTDAQLARRGRSIARGKSKGTKDRLWKAIVASKWGSQERYAPERLRVSPPSLNAYRKGDTACPRRVADLVNEDFGIGHEYWPKGVVD